MSSPPQWTQLKEAASQRAQARLGVTHGLITEAVAQFHDDASTAVRDLSEAPPEEGLGVELFKALTDVLMVAFPEHLVLEKAAAEAIKGFRDVMIAVISAQEKVTSALTLTLADAKSQLNHVLDELAYSFRSGADQGYSTGYYRIDDSLDAFFEAHPEYKNLEFDANAHATADWLCDRIGIMDAPSHNPADHITAALWAKFNAELSQVAWSMKMDHTPALDRMSLDFTRWQTLDAHAKIEMLSERDHAGRLDLLHGAGASIGSPDQVAHWLRLAEEWENPHNRQAVEMELLTMEWPY